MSRAAPASTFCRRRTTSSRRRRTSLPQRKRTTTSPRSSKRVSFAVMTSRFTPVKTRRLCRSRLSAARASSLRSPTSCRKKCTSLPPLPLAGDLADGRRHSRFSYRRPHERAVHGRQPNPGQSSALNLMGFNCGHCRLAACRYVGADLSRLQTRESLKWQQHLPASPD